MNPSSTESLEDIPVEDIPAANVGAHRAVRESRILIADDERLSRRLLAGILQKQNFTNLQFAEGGRETLELVHSFRPDLVLLDMQMPDIDGLAVCKAMRTFADFTDIPILVQTATVGRREMGKLFDAGASDFLSKPVNPYELVARVIVHLERRNSLLQLRSYRKRISLELDAARRMQSELLPSSAAQQAVAEAAGLRMASYSRSSSEIGGDIWGLLPIDDRRFAIFLADFTGHGVTAALNTFRLHALIHEYRSLHEDPSALLRKLNDRLVPLLPPGQFATFLYVVIDHAEGALRFASAGAPSPILGDVQGPSSLFQTSGVPLGIEPGVQYAEQIHAFPRDSRLLLFSDGLPDFPSQSGQRIGELGLVAAMDASPHDLMPQELIDGLCCEAGIKDDAVLPDDTTIVCIDRRIGKQPTTCHELAETLTMTRPAIPDFDRPDQER